MPKWCFEKRKCKLQTKIFNFDFFTIIRILEVFLILIRGKLDFRQKKLLKKTQNLQNCKLMWYFQRWAILGSNTQLTISYSYCILHKPTLTFKFVFDRIKGNQIKICMQSWQNIWKECKSEKLSGPMMVPKSYFEYVYNM